MEGIVQGWSLTIVLCGAIVVVFAAGWMHVHRELAWVKALTDQLGVELVASDPARQPASLDQQQIRDEARAVVTGNDPTLAQKQVRTWQMRAQRLESAL